MKKFATYCCMLLLFQTVHAIDPDTTYNNQFRRDIGGWIAADATYSILLPDGRTLWLFGDTFLGEVNPDNSIKPGSKMIRNSAVIQDGTSLVTLYGGTPSTPSDFIPTQHPDSTWYWPEHGIVEDDTLRIFVAKFRESGGGTPGFNFEHAGNDIANFTYPELEFISTVPILASPVNEVLYGNRILADTQYVYIYGRRPDPEYNIPYPHVARTELGTVMSLEWEYFDGGGWSSDPFATKRINSFQVSQQYCVSTYRGKYILLTQDIWLSPKIYSFTSDSPTGPWSNKKLLYTTPETEGSTFTYNAYVHPQFDRNGEMLVSYNVNGDFFSIFSNVEIYRPRFIRIPYMNLDFAFWPNNLQENKIPGNHSVSTFPNPVTGNATLKFNLDRPQEVRIELTGSNGSIRISVADTMFGAGNHNTLLEMNELPAGIYFCTVTFRDHSQTVPIIKTSFP